MDGNQDLNDTVRLGLLLKKLKILIRLKKFNFAESLLLEIEKMSGLLLKNKRILLYMEEEYNLLTFYKQEFLDLKSEFYFEKSLIAGEKQQEELTEKSKHFILEMMVDSSKQTYGDIFNIPLRIQGLKRLAVMLEGGSNRDFKKISTLQRLITFTKNQKRRILFLVDCTTECIEYIDDIRNTFREVEHSITIGHGEGGSQRRHHHYVCI